MSGYHLQQWPTGNGGGNHNRGGRGGRGGHLGHENYRGQSTQGIDRITDWPAQHIAPSTGSFGPGLMYRPLQDPNQLPFEIVPTHTLLGRSHNANPSPFGFITPTDLPYDHSTQTAPGVSHYGTAQRQGSGYWSVPDMEQRRGHIDQREDPGRGGYGGAATGRTRVNIPQAASRPASSNRVQKRRRSRGRNAKMHNKLAKVESGQRESRQDIDEANVTTKEYADDTVIKAERDVVDTVVMANTDVAESLGVVSTAMETTRNTLKESLENLARMRAEREARDKRLELEQEAHYARLDLEREAGFARIQAEQQAHWEKIHIDHKTRLEGLRATINAQTERVLASNSSAHSTDRDPRPSFAFGSASANGTDKDQRSPFAFGSASTNSMDRDLRPPFMFGSAQCQTEGEQKASEASVAGYNNLLQQARGAARGFGQDGLRVNAPTMSKTTDSQPRPPSGVTQASEKYVHHVSEIRKQTTVRTAELDTSWASEKLQGFTRRIASILAEAGTDAMPEEARFRYEYLAKCETLLSCWRDLLGFVQSRRQILGKELQRLEESALKAISSASDIRAASSAMTAFMKECTAIRSSTTGAEVIKRLHETMRLAYIDMWTSAQAGCSLQTFAERWMRSRDLLTEMLDGCLGHEGVLTAIRPSELWQANLKYATDIGDECVIKHPILLSGMKSGMENGVAKIDMLQIIEFFDSWRTVTGLEEEGNENA